MEPDVVVSCLQRDLKAVQSCLTAVAKQFEDLTKRKIKLSVDTNNFLATSTYGPGYYSKRIARTGGILMNYLVLEVLWLPQQTGVSDARTRWRADSISYPSRYAAESCFMSHALNSSR